MHVRTTCIPSLAQAGTTPNLMLLVVTSCYPGIFHAMTHSGHSVGVVRRVGSEGWIGGLDLRKTSCGVLMCCIHSHHHTGILVCCVG